MSKLQLKNAMDSLQVKKPLRLPISTPLFQVPASNLGGFFTQGTIQPQVEEPAPTENETRAKNKTSVENSTRDQSQTEFLNPTPVDFSTQVENKTQVQKQTSVENSSGVRRATEQDSSVVLEAQSAEKLELGYTRLPNAILMRLVSGDLTRNEIKLTLLIARFTISFQRKKAPLSKNVLERITGLRGSAILEAIAGLISKGIVEKEQGDQNRPNLLGLVLPENWDLPPKNPTSKNLETQVINLAKVEKPTEAKIRSSAGVQNSTSAPVGKPDPYKITTYPASASELGDDL